MKKVACIILCLLAICTVAAQDDPVLMRIGGRKVLRSEFAYYYHKENRSLGGERRSLEELATLFVNLKLKVSAAEALGLDTLRSFRDEWDDCRRALLQENLVGSTTPSVSEEEEQAVVGELFLPLPQNATASVLRRAEARMDSLYRVLSDTTRHAELFGTPRTVSRLQTVVEYEDSVFSITPGHVSRPFYTPQGLYIIKVYERRRCSKQFSPRMDEDILRQRVEEWKKQYAYTPDEVAVNELLRRGTTTRTLFTLGEDAYTEKQFRLFAASHPAAVKRQWEMFVQKSVLDYAATRLTDQPSDVRLLLQEYRDGLLAYAAACRVLPLESPADSAALQSYFESHRSHYRWQEPRYRGVVLRCVSKQVAKQARKLLRALPEEEWSNAIRLTFNKHSDTPRVLIEQGLFAPGDNPRVDERVFKRGKCTPDTAYPIVVLLGKKQKAPATFAEVDSSIADDYLRYCESLWVASLRAGVMVEIDQEVLKSVNNH